MNQQGFMLLEIIVVTLIIGVVAAFAVPLTLNLQRQVVLEYEAERFIADYRHLQSIARFSAPNTIQLSFNTNSYTVIDNNPIGGWQTVKHKFSPQVTAAWQGNKKRWLIFQDDGTPNVGMTIILMCNDGNFKRRIIISRERIRMERQ